MLNISSWWNTPEPINSLELQGLKNDLEKPGVRVQRNALAATYADIHGYIHAHEDKPIWIKQSDNTITLSLQGKKSVSKEIEGTLDSTIEALYTALMSKSTPMGVRDVTEEEVAKFRQEVQDLTTTIDLGSISDLELLMAIGDFLLFKDEESATATYRHAMELSKYAPNVETFRSELTRSLTDRFKEGKSSEVLKGRIAKLTGKDVSAIEELGADSLSSLKEALDFIDGYSAELKKSENRNDFEGVLRNVRAIKQIKVTNPKITPLITSILDSIGSKYDEVFLEKCREFSSFIELSSEETEALRRLYAENPALEKRYLHRSTYLIPAWEEAFRKTLLLQNAYNEDFSLHGVAPLIGEWKELKNKVQPPLDSLIERIIQRIEAMKYIDKKRIQSPLLRSEILSQWADKTMVRRLRKLDKDPDDVKLYEAAQFFEGLKLADPLYFNELWLSDESLAKQAAQISKTHPAIARWIPELFKLDSELANKIAFLPDQVLKEVGSLPTLYQNDPTHVREVVDLLIEHPIFGLKCLKNPEAIMEPFLKGIPFEFKSDCRSLWKTNRPLALAFKTMAQNQGDILSMLPSEKWIEAVGKYRAGEFRPAPELKGLIQAAYLIEPEKLVRFAKNFPNEKDHFLVLYETNPNLASEVIDLFDLTIQEHELLKKTGGLPSNFRRVAREAAAAYKQLEKLPEVRPLRKALLESMKKGTFFIGGEYNVTPRIPSLEEGLIQAKKDLIRNGIRFGELESREYSTIVQEFTKRFGDVGAQHLQRFCVQNFPLRVIEELAPTIINEFGWIGQPPGLPIDETYQIVEDANFVTIRQPTSRAFYNKKTEKIAYHIGTVTTRIPKAKLMDGTVTEQDVQQTLSFSPLIR